jgi:hypothetical protein
MKSKMKGVMIIFILAVFGFSTIAFADWGRGYGHRMGRGMMGPGWQGESRYYGNYSSDEFAKLDQQRADFFRATEDLRQQLYEKELSLQSELAKEEPDITKASKLQREISKLQGDLDQKRSEYDIQARNSVPNYNRDYRGHGPMMGYGPRGGGYCRW